MKKIIPALFTLLLLFSGCSKEETVIYDMVICDTSLSGLTDYLSSFESDNYRVKNIDFKADQTADLLTYLKENNDGLNSITIYSDNITKDQAEEFILVAEDNNIPVIFSFADLDAETLESYDKAVGIDTDYFHAAEITAEKITDYWNENIIIDSDDNKIFKFAVISDKDSCADFKNFHNTLINCIELYGIPMQITKTINSQDIDSDEDLEEIKSENEGIIIISDSADDYIENYTADGDGVEIITITHDTEKLFSDKFSVLNCFVNHTQYKKAVEEIISNFNSHRYLFEDISFPYIGKSVYISATI